MFKKITLLYFVLLISSCNNKAEIDKLLELQKEVESLKIKNENLLVQNEKLTQSIDSIILINNETNKNDESNKAIDKTTHYYSDKEALEYVRDYYDFYKADYVIRNIRVRRIAKNKFHVSIEEMSKNIMGIEEKIAKLKGEEVKWDSNNYTLTIFNEKNYILK